MRGLIVTLSLAFAAFGCAKTQPVMDTTIGVSSICPVHRLQMEKREVSVSSGVPGPIRRLVEMAKLAGSTELFSKEEKELFPHSNPELWAGDEIDARTPRKGFVYICHDCLNAFAMWKTQKAANQPPQPTPANRRG